MESIDRSSRLSCPACGRTVALDDQDPGLRRALCRNCNRVFFLAEVHRELLEQSQVALDPSRPPQDLFLREAAVDGAYQFHARSRVRRSALRWMVLGCCWFAATVTLGAGITMVLGLVLKRGPDAVLESGIPQELSL